jgi:hypothetical protein
LAQTLVRKEKEDFILDDGAAHVSAKLIALERRRTNRVEFEEVACIKRVVAEELKHFAMKVVGARARGKVDDGAGTLTVFGAESRIVDLEFPDRVNRRLETYRTKGQVVESDPVYQIVDGLFTISAGVDSQSPQAPQWRR